MEDAELICYHVSLVDERGKVLEQIAVPLGASREVHIVPALTTAWLRIEAIWRAGPDEGKDGPVEAVHGQTDSTS
jgi:hypothetical protein